MNNCFLNISCFFFLFLFSNCPISEICIALLYCMILIYSTGTVCYTVRRNATASSRRAWEIQAPFGSVQCLMIWHRSLKNESWSVILQTSFVVKRVQVLSLISAGRILLARDFVRCAWRWRKSTKISTINGGRNFIPPRKHLLQSFVIIESDICIACYGQDRRIGVKVRLLHLSLM